MDKASDLYSEDCGFESRRGCIVSLQTGNRMRKEAGESGERSATNRLDAMAARAPRTGRMQRPYVRHEFAEMPAAKCCTQRLEAQTGLPE